MKKQPSRLPKHASQISIRFFEDSNEKSPESIQRFEINTISIYQISTDSCRSFCYNKSMYPQKDPKPRSPSHTQFIPKKILTLYSLVTQHAPIPISHFIRILKKKFFFEPP